MVALVCWLQHCCLKLPTLSTAMQQLVKGVTYLHRMQQLELSAEQPGTLMQCYRRKLLLSASCCSIIESVIH